MKMTMHIDKSQIKSVEKYVGGDYAVTARTFQRTPAIQAGFKTIDLMCIGGRGGASSQATLNYWGSGGGGGGSIKRRVALTALPSEVLSYVPGQAGQHWSAGGFDGGRSQFGSWWADGGKGAGGISGGWGTPDVYASIGGEGGGNSDSPLEGGNGGYPAFGWGGFNYARTLPENGPWTDLGSGNSHGGGGGGGGGATGRAGYASAPSDGGGGNVNGAFFGAPPSTFPTAGYGGNYGGMGGGANLALLTGVNEYYGSNGFIPYGVVAYILT